jgi:hypothetical protein
MATGYYFRSPQNWTLDRDEAYDFGLVSRAMKAAHRLRIRELELELSFEDLEQAAVTPFQTFVRGLSRPRRHSVNGRHASRSAALA